MLISADRFLDIPVMSLQTGSELARTSREIINPKNLSIIAYELEGRLLDQHPSLLRIDDVREIGPLGMIIDSTDEIIGIDDVITIKEIYEINFTLMKKIRKSEKLSDIRWRLGILLYNNSEFGDRS